MNSPLVSVIMPVYNAEAYVGDAITSVINQTYKNWELLITDDGSTDDTTAVIKSFTDSRIQQFQQTNQGVSAARNTALSQMKGDYFCFLDADDVMPTRSLESRLKVFSTNDKIAFVDGTVLVKDKVLRKTIRRYRPSFVGNPYHELLRVSDKCFFGPSWMIKRGVGQNYRFKERLTHGEDLLFYLSIARQGSYASTSKEILWYRSGNMSAMTNLQGLEQGYVTIYQHLENQYEVDQKQLAVLKKKIRTIMAKSYLGNGQPINAIRSFYSLSRL